MKGLTCLFVFLAFSFSFSLTAADLPEKFVPLDTNEDGLIDRKEVEAVIDQYFEEDPGYTALFIHDLIDYFFEQE